ncbi:MAG: hypothetical protein CBB97_22645 [Candidatus Endolissoclinum sp. TMED37]|nr:MAG: hypothetical protein CBB97_22645 [Candidatus Endolissoclinum sp. TMED37]
MSMFDDVHVPLKSQSEIDQLLKTDSITVNTPQITISPDEIPNALYQYLHSKNKTTTLSINVSPSTLALTFLKIPNLLEVIQWSEMHNLDSSIHIELLILMINKEISIQKGYTFNSMRINFKNRLFSSKNYTLVRPEPNNEEFMERANALLDSEYPQEFRDNNKDYIKTNLFYDEFTIDIHSNIDHSQFNNENIEILVNNIYSIDPLKAESIYKIFLMNPSYSLFALKNKKIRNLFLTHKIIKLRDNKNLNLFYAFQIGFHNLLIQEMKQDYPVIFNLDDIQGIPIAKNIFTCQHPFLKQIVEVGEAYLINYKPLVGNVTLPTYQQVFQRINIFSGNLFAMMDQTAYDLFFDKGNTKCFFSGSMLAACLSPQDTEFNFIDYIKKNYHNSDIDCAVFDPDLKSPIDLESFVASKLKILNQAVNTLNNTNTQMFTMYEKNNRFRIKGPWWLSIPEIEYYKIPFDSTNCYKHFTQYHFAFVRAWWDGYTINMLPSAVVAFTTMITLDIRFCSSTTPPQHLILKYMKRGFNIPLNAREKRHMFKLLGLDISGPVVNVNRQVAFNYYVKNATVV